MAVVYPQAIYIGLFGRQLIVRILNFTILVFNKKCNWLISCYFFVMDNQNNISMVGLLQDL